MLTFFRTNQVFYSVMLIVYILLLRFSVFIAPFQWEPSGQGVLCDMLYNAVGSQGLAAHIIAMVLLMGQGYLVNLISINYRLSNDINLLPGLFYVWCCCARRMSAVCTIGFTSPNPSSLKLRRMISRSSSFSG